MKKLHSVVALVLSLAVPLVVHAQPEAQILPALAISSGKSHVISAPNDLSRVSVGNPEIADIALIRSRDVYVIGKSVGSTNIFMWGPKGELSVMDVLVSADTAGLASKLQELMPEETSIQVRSAGDSLVLMGRVRDAVKIQNAALIAERFSGKKIINLLGLNDVPQVLLEVKVAEVSKTLTDKLGVGLGLSGSDSSFRYSLLSSFLTGGTFSAPLTGALNDTLGNVLSDPLRNGGGISIEEGENLLRLEAEIKNGLIKVLAEPNIIAISGQEGAFLAGGKVFIPVPSGDGDITLKEEEYGVGLKFVPTVLDSGKINLRVTPEVSELARDGARVRTSGREDVLTVITTRRASTTVQLMDGQTFAIGGLIKNDITETIRAFPVLGELPIIGALFRSSEFISDRSELMFLVTPRLVKPLAQPVALPTDRFNPPARSEFMLEGKLESSGLPSDAVPFVTLEQLQAQNQ